MPDRLLSIRETCAATGLGKTKVTELVLAGDIRSLKVGRRRLVPESAIDDFIAANTGERGRRNLKAV